MLCKEKPVAVELFNSVKRQSQRDGGEIVRAEITSIEAAILGIFREYDDETQFRTIARFMNELDASKARSPKAEAPKHIISLADYRPAVNGR